MSFDRNRRILVVHHDDSMDSRLQEELGDRYLVHAAADHDAACEQLAEAKSLGEPYAVAFVHRVDFIEKLWDIDDQLEIVLCTSACPSMRELRDTDRLLILKKPFDRIEVLQLAASLTEKWNFAQQAGMKLSELEVAIGSRTTELQEANQRLQHEALHDRLTGLPNRAFLLDRISHCINRVKRRPDACFALLFLDLDRFKIVNDSLGHAVGDELLMMTSHRLQECIRSNDMVSRSHSDTTLARLGGDEFTILLEDLREPADAARVAQRIVESVSRPIVINGHEIVTSVSIGVAPGHANYAPDALLRDADAAMYRAKAQGRGQYAIFDADLHRQAIARLKLEADLRQALPRSEFYLDYQPIIQLETCRLQGFEALLRWRHPERGLVSPGEFISVAEDIGLITPIGEWVINAAVDRLQHWQTLYASQPLTMSVNLSRKQLSSPNLIPHLKAALARTGIEPANLKLEITESVIMEDAERNCRVLTQIKELGVGLDMDDFGTGYSSLSCINRFPLDGLKIDRTFIQTMVGRKAEMAIVHAILALAASLEMSVTAEGVETVEQVAVLTSLGCHQVQGYHFSRPLSADAASAYIAQATTRAMSA